MRDRSIESYKRLWDTMIIRPDRAPIVEQALANIIPRKHRYLDSVAGTRVPWVFIAALHYRECDNDFSRQILNGQPYESVTTLVPKGRGPWDSWEDSTRSAIDERGYDEWNDWQPEWMLRRLERHNGWGYALRNLNSPYVWAGTNHQQPGMFDEDERGSWFNFKKIDQRIGGAVVVKAIIEQGES